MFLLNEARIDGYVCFTRTSRTCTSACQPIRPSVAKAATASLVPGSLRHEVLAPKKSNQQKLDAQAPAGGYASVRRGATI